MHECCMCVWPMGMWNVTLRLPLCSFGVKHSGGEGGTARRGSWRGNGADLLPRSCCLLTLPGMCLPVDYYQLFFPAGPGRVTVFVRCSEASVFAQLARCSPPTCISHCPPSNEYQRIDSLTRLILPPNCQMKRRPLPWQRGKSQVWDSGNEIEKGRD